jgi:hypothetical protein
MLSRGAAPADQPANRRFDRTASPRLPDAGLELHGNGGGGIVVQPQDEAALTGRARNVDGLA